MLFVKSVFVVSLLHLIPLAASFSLLGSGRFRIKKFNKETPAPAAPKYGPFYMEMPLDHFSNDSQISFQNRYWVNTDHYKPNGPIILVNEGEAGVTQSAEQLSDSSAAQLGERLNGIIVLIEHRFYGDSKPNITTFSDSDTTLYGLSSDQALADMAHLIENIEFPEELNVPPVPETKVIVFGCSYSGNLAAWMRQKYPELVYAAVAGSAPVRAQVDFHEYFDPIMRYGSPPCITALQDMISYVDSILFGGSTEDVKQLKHLFNVDTLYDDDFASYLSYPLGNWQYASNTTYNIFNSEFCESVFNPQGEYQLLLGQTYNLTTLQRNVLAYSNYLQVTYEDSCTGYDTLSDCFDTHNATNIELQRESSLDSVSWVWQFCNEFGYFQVAPPQGQPTIVSRKYDVNAQESLCTKYFKNLKIPALPNVQKINDEHNGWNIDLDRVIWIDGEYDNWRELSVHSPLNGRTFDDNPNVASIIISKASHCVNWYGLDNSSTDYLRSIQDQQYETLINWLQQN